MATDRRVPFDHRMRPDGGAGADPDMRTNHGIGAHLNIRGELRTLMDHSGGMDEAHGPPLHATLRMVHISSACTATSSPTVAQALYL